TGTTPAGTIGNATVAVTTPGGTTNVPGGYDYVVLAELFAYVANSGDGSVSVINTATNAVIDTIAVGQGVSDVAVYPGGNRAYAINGIASVSVIDTVTNTVIDTIAVGLGPAGVAVLPDGSRVYVSSANHGSVSVIDTVTNTVIDTIAVGASLLGIAVSPDGGRVYAVNPVDRSVAVIDTSSNAVIGTVYVGGAGSDGPVYVQVTPDGGHGYVTNTNGSVDVFSTRSNAVTATITVGGSPNAVAVSPGGGEVYVANGADDSVSVIDTSVNEVSYTVSVNGPSYGIAVTQNGWRVYVSLNDSDLVSVIDTRVRSVVDSVAVGDAPVGVAIQYAVTLPPTISVITPSSGTTAGGTPFTVTGTNLHDAVVTFNGAPATSVTVNTAGTSLAGITPPATAGNATVMVTTAGGSAAAPGGFSYSGPPPLFAYVSSVLENWVSVIDTRDNTVAVNIPVDSSPQELAVASGGKYVYVVGFDGSVSVIDTATNSVIGTIAVGQ
ncbi:IPT/TIG domain-containing protein, partial [Streptomyces kronopolitis]